MVSGAALAAPQDYTFTGTISCGTLDCSIDNDQGEGYIFFLQALKGFKRLFSQCKNGDKCTVSGKFEKDVWSQGVGRLIEVKAAIKTN